MYKMVLALNNLQWLISHKTKPNQTNNSTKHQSFVCTQLNHQTVLFHPLIGVYQVLPLRTRVDSGAKGCSAFPKSLSLLEPYYQNFNVISRTFIVGGNLTRMQRCCRCILSSQPTGLKRKRDSQEIVQALRFCHPDK